jgi:branched-chain amino acid transport system substrate-binding protein
VRCLNNLPVLAEVTVASSGRGRVLGAVLIIGLLGVLAFVWIRHPKDQGSVVIGAVLPMTGDAGSFGLNVSRGATLAVAQANTSLGAGSLRFVLKVEDSRGDAQGALTAVRKLIDVDGAKLLIGDVTSAGTQALIPIATRESIPLISPAASDPALSGASPFFARLWPSDVYEAKVVADYFKKSSTKKLAAVYANTDYGVAMVREFTKAIEPVQPVVSIPLNRETLDYRPTLQRLRIVAADNIFLVLYPEDARRFLQQMAEQSIELPIIATATIEDPQIAKLSNANLITFASPLPPKDTEPDRQRFIVAYRKSFGSEPGVLSDIGFDTANLLVAAVRARGINQPKTIIDFIKGLSGYKGISGKLTFNSAGDVTKPYGLKVVRGGKFTWAT